MIFINERGEGLFPSPRISNGNGKVPEVPCSETGNNLSFHTILFQPLYCFEMFFAFTHAWFLIVSVFTDILWNTFLDTFPFKTLQSSLNIFFITKFNGYQCYHNLYYLSMLWH